MSDAHSSGVLIGDGADYVRLSFDKQRYDHGLTTATIDVKAGPWEELRIEIPATGPLGIVRVYVPATDKPVDVDWIEVQAKSVNRLRSDFEAR